MYSHARNKSLDVNFFHLLSNVEIVARHLLLPGYRVWGDTENVGVLS